MKKGIFCISIDTELLWGRKDLDYSKFIEKTKKERLIIKKLLTLFKKYGIPATWAIVGRLYEKGDELWSGIDIISWIKTNKIHELASHSYSHEDISKISKEDASQEFKKPKADTFIFPRNHIAYLNILKKNGFKAYRGVDETTTTSNMVQLLKLLVGSVPQTNKPIHSHGLVNIPGSMYFVSNRGLRKYIPQGVRSRRAKLGIEKAIANKEVFHLWFHPVDFADNTVALMLEFEEILKYAFMKREEGLLEIETMYKIAEDYDTTYKLLE